MASDAESDEFGAFDLSEFTLDDFAQIDTDVATHFQPTEIGFEDASAANESFEFDASLDLFNLTEEDLLEIDNAVTLQLGGTTPAAPAPFLIEAPKPGPSRPVLEQPPPPKADTRWRYKGKKKAWDEKTLLEKYRPSGVLSVSDLVGPVWCEVQFDYGLRQKRSRPVNARPKSFKTNSGKEITVETTVAAKNDVITKQGQAIHKELEREIRVEEIRVDITTDEERWGLRLLNMLACLQIVMTEGMIREMPVFGLVNGEAVVGIIDEINRVPYQEPPKRRGSNTGLVNASKRQRKSPGPNQHDIEDYFQPSDTPQAPKLLADNGSSTSRKATARYSLQISDTKTRVFDSLPAEADTLGPKLQVMLYRRLFSELISVEDPFDFTALWNHLNIDSTIEFSTGFLVQAGLLMHNDGFPTTNLDGLVDSWKRMVEASSIAGVDPSLQLVYRLQPRDVDNPIGKGTDALGFRTPQQSAALTAEARDIARAIRNSLFESKSRVDALQTGEDADIDVELQDALYKSLAPHLPEGSVDAGGIPAVDGPEKPVIETDIHGYKIIGRKQFMYDSVMLQDHLNSVFELWRGERLPIGVPVELARRCNTCEYRTGCEWREEKALELTRRASGEGVRLTHA